MAIALRPQICDVTSLYVLINGLPLDNGDVILLLLLLLLLLLQPFYSPFPGPPGEPVPEDKLLGPYA